MQRCAVYLRSTKGPDSCSCTMTCVLMCLLSSLLEVARTFGQLQLCQSSLKAQLPGSDNEFVSNCLLSKGFPKAHRYLQSLSRI